jgi:hypothetical protein
MHFLPVPTVPVRILRTAALSVLLLLWAIPGYGQLMQTVQLDAGNSTVSDRAFLRPAVMVDYRFDKFSVGTGLQWTFSSAERKVLSGGFISGSSDFKVREIPLTADLFVRRNPYSDIVRETLLGAVLKHEGSRLDIHFGYNMRRYRLNENGVVSDTPFSGPALSIWEYRNFMYRGTLHLNRREAPWNLSVSVTNFDHFLIQQETNPMVNLAGYIRVSDAVKIHSSLWYQGAGMSNIHANHYGFYFRTGVVWQVGSLL